MTNKGLELQIQNGKIQKEAHENEEKKKKMIADISEQELEDYYRDMPLTDDTSCGFWMFKGSKLQLMANKKILVLLFGLAGCCFASTYSYFNGTITTMEKRFRIPSKTTGIISVGNDITQLLASVVLNYYAAKGHRPRWIAFGLYCVAAFCFMNALPHFMYGAGEDAIQLTFEYGTDYMTNSTETKAERERKNLCYSDKNVHCNLEDGSVVPPIIWFVSQLISGIGGVLFYSLGYSYLDDNIKKSKSPAFISFTYFMRMLGPAFGYGLVSVCLKLYIAPALSPTIDNLDPRWLGAWWLGWLILGVLMIIFANLIALLPKTLPRAAARKELLKQKGKSLKSDELVKPSLADMWVTIKRLMTNKVYIYNQLASIFYVFGYIPFWIFLPKYIETQYRKSASIASLVTGTVGLVFAALGILLAGLIVQKFKPKARYMACWNMIIDIIALLGIVVYYFLGCPEVDQQIPIFSDGELNTTATCNSNCKCDYVKFSPVCSAFEGHTFISACHAGCNHQTSLDNGTIIYSNCSCIAPSAIPHWFNTSDDWNSSQGGIAISGPCPVDCNYQFYSFIAIICILKLFGSLSRVTNFLVSVRCVEERDKTVSLGINLATISLFALIPAPIFFGYIIDSACLVWGKTCAGTGNCWFFNSKLMRERIIFTSVPFLLIGVLFGVMIWLNVKDLNMFYDVVETDKEVNSDEKKEDIEELEKLNKPVNEV